MASDGSAFQRAGIAHLAERHLAKVEVASSNLVARSKSFGLSRGGGIGLEWAEHRSECRSLSASHTSFDGAIAKR